MNVTVTIGNRLIPLEHIVAVEPFDPETQLPIPSERSRMPGNPQCPWRPASNT